MTSLEMLPITPTQPQASLRPEVVPQKEAETFGRLMQDLGVRIDSGEALMRGASEGRYAGLDAGRLIALQAGIYRYGEAIELSAKLVDRAANSVRAVLQAGH
jgi:hypothetical protein